MSLYVDLKFRMGNYLARFPGLYYALAGLLFKEKSGQKRVSEDIEIIIDGYPRSANTFSYWAFLYAQGDRVAPDKVAHHIHKSAQIIRGISLGKPVVLLIREPKDCVVSLLIRQPGISMKGALQAYCWFYEALLPYKNKVVVADFEQVSTDYGKVIDAVNARYGTAYVPFDHTEAHVQEVYALLKKGPDALKGSAADESRVAMPSDARKSQKEALVKVYEEPAYRQLAERANKVYAAYVAQQ